MGRQRTEFLLRRNLGRLRGPEILAELSAAFGRPLTREDALSLEEGDRVRSLVLSLAQMSRERGSPPAFSVWSEAAAGALGRGLARLGGRLAGAELYYLPIAWDFLGPIRVQARDLARAVEVARGTAAEQCAVCTSDGTDGLWLEYQANEAEHGASFPYELTVWGAPWLALTQETLPFALAGDEA